MDAVLDMRVLFQNVKSVVSVHDHTVPHDNGVNDNAIGKNVFLKLTKLLSRQWGDLTFKFRVYS